MPTELINKNGIIESGKYSVAFRIAPRQPDGTPGYVWKCESRISDRIVIGYFNGNPTVGIDGKLFKVVKDNFACFENSLTGWCPPSPGYYIHDKMWKYSRSISYTEHHPFACRDINCSVLESISIPEGISIDKIAAGKDILSPSVANVCIGRSIEEGKEEVVVPMERVRGRIWQYVATVAPNKIWIGYWNRKPVRIYQTIKRIVKEGTTIEVSNDGGGGDICYTVRNGIFVMMRMSNRGADAGPFRARFGRRVTMSADVLAMEGMVIR